MAADAYRYVIVGASLAGASAVKGIRQQDPNGSNLLIGRKGFGSRIRMGRTC